MSWLSDAVHSAVGWAAGHGNEPGTPTTRKYGYDPTAVANAAAAQIEAMPPAPAVNPTMQAAVLVGAGLAVLFLLSKPKGSAKGG